MTNELDNYVDDRLAQIREGTSKHPPEDDVTILIEEVDRLLRMLNAQTGMNNQIIEEVNRISEAAKVSWMDEFAAIETMVTKRGTEGLELKPEWYLAARVKKLLDMWPRHKGQKVSQQLFDLTKRQKSPEDDGPDAA